MNMFDPPPLSGLKLPEVTLCDELGVQAYMGACPVHGGDACLAVFVPASQPCRPTVVEAPRDHAND